MKAQLFTWLNRLSLALLYIGAAIVLVQTVWITYGVGVRYLLNEPDGMVTEATALLLVPVAFLGVSYALLNNAYPRVSIFRDKFPRLIRVWVDKLSMLVMLAVSGFFLAASAKAMFKSMDSGAASEILLWPRFYFWVPVVVALLMLCISALCLLILGEPETQKKTADTKRPADELGDQ